jgi:hypothetical protein
METVRLTSPPRKGTLIPFRRRSSLPKSSNLEAIGCIFPGVQSILAVASVRGIDERLRIIAGLVLKDDLYLFNTA